MNASWPRLIGLGPTPAKEEQGREQSRRLGNTAYMQTDTTAERVDYAIACSR